MIICLFLVLFIFTKYSLCIKGNNWFIFFLHQLQLHGSYHEDGTDLLRLEDCLKDKFGENSEAECRELISVIEKVYIYAMCLSPAFDNPRSTCVVNH